MFAGCKKAFEVMTRFVLIHSMNCERLRSQTAPSGFGESRFGTGMGSLMHTCIMEWAGWNLGNPLGTRCKLTTAKTERLTKKRTSTCHSKTLLGAVIGLISCEGGPVMLFSCTLMPEFEALWELEKNKTVSCIRVCTYYVCIEKIVERFGR